MEVSSLPNTSVILGSPFHVPMLKLHMFQVVLVAKNPPANARDVRDAGLTAGLGRSPGGGHILPLQCSHLEKPKDRGAWWAAVHGVPKS